MSNCVSYKKVYRDITLLNRCVFIFETRSPNNNNHLIHLFSRVKVQCHCEYTITVSLPYDLYQSPPN